MAATSASAALLGRQLKQMQTDKDIPGISCGLADSSVYEWEVMLMISDECKYYGGEFGIDPLLSWNVCLPHHPDCELTNQRTNCSRNNI
jgi:ubiquitin-protein ligase